MQISVTIHFYVYPTLTLMAFSGVTNAHGPPPNSMQVSNMQSDDCNRK